MKQQLKANKKLPKMRAINKSTFIPWPLAMRKGAGTPSAQAFTAEDTPLLDLPGSADCVATLIYKACQHSRA